MSVAVFGLDVGSICFDTRCEDMVDTSGSVENRQYWHVREKLILFFREKAIVSGKESRVVDVSEDKSNLEESDVVSIFPKDKYVVSRVQHFLDLLGGIDNKRAKSSQNEYLHQQIRLNRPGPSSQKEICKLLVSSVDQSRTLLLGHFVDGFDKLKGGFPSRRAYLSLKATKRRFTCTGPKGSIGTKVSEWSPNVVDNMVSNNGRRLCNTTEFYSELSKKRFQSFQTKRPMKRSHYSKVSAATEIADGNEVTSKKRKTDPNADGPIDGAFDGDEESSGAAVLQPGQVLHAQDPRAVQPNRVETLESEAMPIGSDLHLKHGVAGARAVQPSRKRSSAAMKTEEKTGPSSVEIEMAKRARAGSRRTKVGSTPPPHSNPQLHPVPAAVGPSEPNGMARPEFMQPQPLEPNLSMSMSNNRVRGDPLASPPPLLLPAFGELTGAAARNSTPSLDTSFNHMGSPGRDGKGGTPDDHAAPFTQRRQRTQLKMLPVDSDGLVSFPIQLGSLLVISLGAIDSSRPAFHTSKFLYPIGYRSVCDILRPVYQSNLSCVCEIVDGGNYPLFRAEVKELRGYFVELSPDAVWSRVLEFISSKVPEMAIPRAATGADLFGLSHPVVQELLQNMQGSEECSRYERIEFLEDRSTKSWFNPDAFKTQHKKYVPLKEGAGVNSSPVRSFSPFGERGSNSQMVSTRLTNEYSNDYHRPPRPEPFSYAGHPMSAPRLSRDPNVDPETSNYEPLPPFARHQ